MCFAWFNILHHHWKTSTLKHRYMSNIYCHKITNRFSNTHLLMYGLTYDEKKVVLFIAGHYLLSECISNSNKFLVSCFFLMETSCAMLCLFPSYVVSDWSKIYKFLKQLLISIRWIRSMLALSIYRILSRATWFPDLQ